MCIRVSKQANQLRDSVPLNTGLRPSSTRAGGNRETLFLPTTGRPLFDGEGNKKKKLSQESLFLTSLVPQTSFKNILSAMHFFLQRSTLWSSRNILQWVSKRIVTFPSLRIQDSRFNERASFRARSNPRIRQPFGEELAIIWVTDIIIRGRVLLEGGRPVTDVSRRNSRERIGAERICGVE